MPSFSFSPSMNYFCGLLVEKINFWIIVELTSLLVAFGVDQGYRPSRYFSTMVLYLN